MASPRELPKNRKWLLTILSLVVVSSCTLVNSQSNFPQKSMSNEIGEIISGLGEKIINNLRASDQSNFPSISVANEIGNIISGWGDKIVGTLRGKLEELTDLNMFSQVIDAAIEEDCSLSDCPIGMRKEPNPDFTPSSNGCGSFGVKWRKDLLPDEGLEECCNTHDYCYDRCGSDRDICDLEFKRCLYAVCNRTTNRSATELKVCKGAAKLMYVATQAFGCKAYQNSQQKSCRCVPDMEHYEL